MGPNARLRLLLLMIDKEIQRAAEAFQIRPPGLSSLPKRSVIA